MAHFPVCFYLCALGFVLCSLRVAFTLCGGKIDELSFKYCYIFPAFAALLLYVLKGENSRIFAILVGILELLFVVLLWNEFNVNYGGIQLSTHYELISSYNISYFVGIDGISLFLLTLNAFITLLTLYFSNI